MVKELYQKVKSILFSDPEELYNEELRYLDQPFHFSGSREEAILLIHGWTSVPYELRRLGRYLNENGYTVYAPMLSGHGTVPKDLEDIKWETWISDVTRSYGELKKRHEKIYVVGTSMGANLAVILSKNKPEIAGLVLLAMPYKIRLEPLVIIFAKFFSLFRKYNKKSYPPTFGSISTITRKISYQTYPVKNALEVPKLVRVSRKVLPQISNPCFMIQSKSDHIVSRRSLDKIYAEIGSKVKKKKYIKRAYHTFIADVKNEGVFEEILEFLEEN